MSGSNKPCCCCCCRCWARSSQSYPRASYVLAILCACTSSFLALVHQTSDRHDNTKHYLPNRKNHLVWWPDIKSFSDPWILTWIFKVRSELLTGCWIIAGKTTALVVSSGCQVSHVLPVVNGRLDASNCKRFVAESAVGDEENLVHNGATSRHFESFLRRPKLRFKCLETCK